MHLETTSFRLQWNREGEIFMRKNGETSQLEFSNQGIETNGVAYIRSFLVSKKFGVPREVSQDIRKSCDLSVKSSIDPWTNMVMGINSKYQLVFQTSDDTCEPLHLNGEMKDYQISRTGVEKAGDFSQVFLEVTFRDGRGEKIYPYY